ncbi:hypothetical protein [Streptomyces sp. NPDC001903]|uniref:hypothetical protein n=1 Tax=Streptomyces sp. NPDC001903 TaxID=3364622 RepID=UPI003689E3BC
MEFVVGDMAISTVGTDGDDRAIEFLVAPRSGEGGGGGDGGDGGAAQDAEPAHFAIHREHDQGWEAARLTIDPLSGSVPIAAVEWAMEFAREYL